MSEGNPYETPSEHARGAPVPKSRANPPNWFSLCIIAGGFLIAAAASAFGADDSSPLFLSATVIILVGVAIGIASGIATDFRSAPDENQKPPPDGPSHLRNS